MDRTRAWRRRSSRYLFESRWFRLRQDELTLPSGEDITYTLVEHGGYVMVVPLLEDGRVVMERVYRYTIDRQLLECPSGGSDGEPAEVAARRELEEETGYRAGALERLGRFYGSTGISDERYDVFLATELRANGRIAREPTEEIELVLLPLAELARRAREGLLEDGPTSLAILLAAARLRA